MKRKKNVQEMIYDEELLTEIAPIGNLRHHETYSRTGTGYEACVHIYEYPRVLDDFWLTNIVQFSNTITTISVGTLDQDEVRRNLNKSIEEQGSRKRFAKDYSAYYNAESREREMQQLFNEMDSLGEVIKNISIRIFVAAPTRNKLEESVAKVIKTMEAISYRAAVFVNEQEQEWKSILQGLELQQKEPHALPGFPMKSTLLAAGNAYHYSSLEDEGGDFLGETACGGNVLFNEWLLNETRVNASAITVGNQRFGKSTLLKLRIKSAVLKGDFIRVFDITGEFTDMIKSFGGRVLDMTDWIINLLEIFKAGDSDYTSYARHLTKLRISYRFLNPDSDIRELNDFIEMIELLYKKWNLLPGKDSQITGLPAKSYPTFSDLISCINEEIEKLVSGTWREGEKILVERKLLSLDNIRMNFRTMLNTYGTIFDGHTSIDNMKDVKVLSYNLSGLKDLDERIFDLQLFNILSMCWDDAITNGSLMKQLYEEKKVTLQNVVHTNIYIDESHRWVNTKKLFAVDLLGIYLREGPKYFCSLCLASQSIRDYTPEGSTKEEIGTLKTIFELTQYKFIFRQDTNAIPIIDRVFGNALTPRQREQIPRYTRGQCTLIISGDKTIDFKVYLSKEDEALFKGGA